MIEKRSEYEKFKYHSERAFRKTFNSFICLAIMMIISFILSTYEYNQVHT